MRKNIFSVVLAVAVFLMPSMAFAVETEAKNAPVKEPAATETPQDLPAKNPSADEQVARDPIANENKIIPVATVADPEEKKKTPSSTEEKTGQIETASSDLSAKKDDKVRTGSEASSALDPAKMQKRWKALFSKDKTPDSIIYTVKPGDSLYVLARKHHTTVDFIKKINGLKSDNIYPKMKLKIHTEPFLIRVDKSKNTLVLYSKDAAVKKYSVATGKKNCTPVGEFKITDKLVHPTWFKTGAILPPGSPENGLGTRWMGFDKPAYGIHGTIEPKSIGTQASEGCIRMLNEEVEELYSIVPVGTKVIIQD